MATPAQLAHNQKDSAICSCNILDYVPTKDQPSEIFLKKSADHGDPCFFAGSVQAPFKIAFPKTEKHSLRRNRLCQAKAKVSKWGNDECQNALSQTMARTEQMSRTQSWLARTGNEFHRLNHYSTFSQFVFVQPIFPEQKKPFGRNIFEKQQIGRNVSEKQQVEKTKENMAPAPQNTEAATCNRSKLKCLTKFEAKQHLKQPFQRHTKSESGEVASQLNFYSQQPLMETSFLSGDLERQVSSIVLKKRTAKKIHHLDQLDCKDTETVNDNESEAASEVISDYSLLEQGGKGRFSQIMVPKFSWKKLSQTHKLSDFKFFK